MTRQEQVLGLQELLRLEALLIKQQAETLLINSRAASDLVAPECREAIGHVAERMQALSAEILASADWLTPYAAPADGDYANLKLLTTE